MDEYEAWMLQQGFTHEDYVNEMNGELYIDDREDDVDGGFED